MRPSPKKTQAVRHAAQVQALQAQRLVMAADDELGAAAADVDHQLLAAVVRHAVGDAQINEPRLLDAGDDFDGMPQRALGIEQKTRAIGGPAQRVGARRAHRARRQAAQALAETAQTGQRLGADGRRQVAVGVQPGAQAHRFAQAVDHLQRIAADARHHQVKAVRAQVHGRDGVEGRTGRRRRPPAGGGCVHRPPRSAPRHTRQMLWRH
uniref:Uncharacterized protein n=1 Tax=uncultured bacterium UPO75 TaxID=1776992 RepID=A0A140DZW0_9BACT|nr:conserved hypothetical protein [uncultured bacterium UPO75]